MGTYSRPAYYSQMSGIGKWIKEIREGAGLSQTEFAEKVGVGVRKISHITVSNWERAVYEPNARNIRAIVRAFPHAPSPPAFGGPNADLSLVMPRTPEAREIAFMVDEMTRGQRQKALRAFRRLFSTG